MNRYPCYAEQSEYRQWVNRNPEHGPRSFVSLFVFKTLNKLEFSVAGDVWKKMEHLDHDEQKLWHVYKDLSGENEAVFIEKIRSFASQDLMAVQSDDLWYLRGSHGFTLKQEKLLHFLEWKANKLLNRLPEF